MSLVAFRRDPALEVALVLVAAATVEQLSFWMALTRERTVLSMA